MNESLGYDSFFEAGRRELGLADLPVARVISESRGVYKVKNGKGEYLAKITGGQMFRARSREDYPAVGDWVAIAKPDDEHAIIRGILPRRTVIKRRYGDRNKAGEKDEVQVIAANIDVAFIVESVDRDYSLNRLERYFAIAESGGVKPAIVLNKTDLLSGEELAEILAEIRKRFPAADIIPTSTATDAGLRDLRERIRKGRTYCFLGSSGVGKSSLINKLLQTSEIKTGDISSYSGRGKHITTRRQMYFLPGDPDATAPTSRPEVGVGTGAGPDATVGAGGMVIDNPGIREVGMTDVGKGIDALFNEITALAQKCKYVDCTHTHEPDCAVLHALNSGKLDESRYSNYVNLKKEAEYYKLNDMERREKDRRFGKFVKKAKKELKDSGRL
ncbi:hypothetical protein A3B35_02790 [Candidatus Kaiserbacteria bacterium RIFCSPLOWO2_01_FULL_54_24]|uniref:Small ribosomal subunit biogenesis GTPase RsgA n=1 Tax=Candidatus Kaiserbacteria bacterium RIFCSPLOWO2_01_FULL_54_24 TaxID=1798515 RepID=A0A1F6EWQ0_9BACT|nr:MAG: hypothetical protein A3B35_02790 [Candidatus Kaiserbacteria bacterium RIFCSPLOWO2_01_FULL_54_24]